MYKGTKGKGALPLVIDSNPALPNVGSIMDTKTNTFLRGMEI